MPVPQLFLLIFTIAATILPSHRVEASPSGLPADYHRWLRSAEKVVSDTSSLFYGIHTIYVDRKALPTYRKGGVYPEGSRFVVEFFSIADSGGRPVRGDKSMIVLMRKDKRQHRTGGWLFAAFSPEGAPSGLDPRKNCFECHLKEAGDRDLVISRFADFNK